MGGSEKYKSHSRYRPLLLLLEDGSLKKDDGIIFPTGTFYKDLVGTKTAVLKKCVITFPLATLPTGIMLRLNFILGLIFVFPS